MLEVAVRRQNAFRIENANKKVCIYSTLAIKMAEY